MDLSDYIRDVPDFPKPGILFKDITTLINHPQAFSTTIDRLTERCRPYQPTHVAALEARGYIFGAPLACNLGAGFTAVRKPGKLPAKTISVDYDLEYGSNTLELHDDSFKAGDRVLIVDDLIATGGSAAATVKLVEKLGAQVVAFGVVIELSFLNGREMLPGIPIEALLSY